MPDKESRGRGKDDDAPKENIETKSKKARTEKKKSGQEQRRRLEDLRRKAEEAKKSSKKTKEVAEKVASEKHKPAVEKEADSVQQEDEPREVGNLVVGKAKNGIIISGITDPSQIEPENIKKIVGEAGYQVEFETPAGFESKTFQEKLDWYKDHGVRIAPAIAGGALPNPDLISLLPDPGADPLGPYVRDMQRAIDPHIDAPVSVSLDRLKGIEEDMDEAVRRGVLVDTDPAVENARAALRQGIESLGSEHYAEQVKNEGYIDFNEHFGNSYKNTKSWIETSNSAALRQIMEEVKAKADLIISWSEVASTLIGAPFDIDDQATWPPPDIISREEIRKLFEVTRALDQAAGELNGRSRILAVLSGGGAITNPDRELLEQFVSKDRNIKMMHQVNAFYNNIYTNLDKDSRKSIAGDIEDNAGPATDSIANGWVDFNPRMKRLFDVFAKNQKFVGNEGALREWRGLFLIDGIEQQVDFANLLKPPEHWEETPESIYALISAAEPLGLGPQDLGQILNAAYGILQRIQTETDFGRAMHFELRELLEAFKIRQSIAITAHLESQDPSQLQRVFKEINGDLESTFTAMISRFTRDSKGRHWYDSNNEAVNLFDPAKKLYSERLRADRIKMNMVEEMTKYSLNDLDIGAIRETVGYKNLPDEWKDVGTAPGAKGRWSEELEKTRKWLMARALQRIAGGIKTPISPVHPYDKRPATLDDWATEPDLRHGLTKAVIEDWYERKTLHGAYGVIDNEGLDEIAGYADLAAPGGFVKGELADIFRKEIIDAAAPGGVRPESDEEVSDRIRKMFEDMPAWQQVRRAEMRQRIRNELKVIGLKYDPNVKFGEKGVAGNLKTLSERALDDLLESGYIASLDTNACDMTWLFEWSTYNMIHIYGRGQSKYDDDFKALVQNKASDLYFASMVDHNWEFLHPDFEDRGRGRQDDVNDLFKKEFIGKHKWLFGHVSMAARFIPSFLDQDGRDLVEARTKKLVEDNKFHNKRYEDSFEDYIRGIAKRELMAEGAISFADEDFSKVAAKRGDLNKFNPIDNAADRALVVKFLGSGLFQSYLSNPSSEMFQKMTTKEDGFMSTRDPRLFPWMEMGLKAHWEVIHNLNYKYFSKPDITTQQMENLVENLVSEGFVEAEQGEKFKNRNLGIAPGILGTAFFRNIRSLWEEEKRENQVKRRGWLLRLFVLVFWTIPIEGLVAGGKGISEDLKKQQH